MVLKKPSFSSQNPWIFFHPIPMNDHVFPLKVLKVHENDLKGEKTQEHVSQIVWFGPTSIIMPLVPYAMMEYHLFFH